MHGQSTPKTIRWRTDREVRDDGVDEARDEAAGGREVRNEAARDREFRNEVAGGREVHNEVAGDRVRREGERP